MQARAGAGDESVHHTVHAAAVVLAAAARSSTGLVRHDQHRHLELHDYAAGATKRRWWSWLSKPKLACFRPHGAHPHRIANASGDRSPPPPAAAAASAAAYVHHAAHPPPPAFAFVAPPSSPASSLFASESPSPPVLLLDTAGTSPSMFAVGPYAHGPQQLVSPPVLYSALTTEPSTAPRTPLAVTNPSSPEVPFARFLGSSLSSSAMTVGRGGEAGRFHAYQLQPGSPIPLASPPGSSSPELFRKLHRRNEGGSLLDGHIPMATGALDLGVPDSAHGGDEEVAKSGEFVFGSADGVIGGAAAPAEHADGRNWRFFPRVEQGMI